MSFTAIYMPSLPPDKESPDRSGFSTEAEAEEYVFENMCTSCKVERKRFLDGTGCKDYASEDFAEEHPACFSEWMVVPTEKAESAESWDDLYKAAGWEKVYSRPESEK